MWEREMYGNVLNLANVEIGIRASERLSLLLFFATAAFVGRALLCSMQNTHLQREEGELGPRIRYLVPFLSLLCVF